MPRKTKQFSAPRRPPVVNEEAALAFITGTSAEPVTTLADATPVAESASLSIVDSTAQKRSPDQPRMTKVSVYLPKGQIRALKVHAASTDTTLSAIAQEAFAAYLKDQA